jgi:tetratricopeptide (TPR) repeat protein
MARDRGAPRGAQSVRDLPAAAPTALGHPAMIVALLCVVAILMLCVTYVLIDPDFWQHLLVGKAIWQTRSVPDQQLWTWPTYGSPDITPSWLFRAMVWPFWTAGGIAGLFAWRWLTTLVAFGLLWATARRMGARGFSALAVLVLCGLAYRTRSQIRPETLVAVLMAVTIWILEVRRQGGPDRTPWLILVACVWANAHISYYLGFVLVGPYLIHDALAARRGAASGRSRLLGLAWVVLAMVAISFLNPFGWRALWQPFDYFLHLRHEPLFKTIVELKPFEWRDNISNGLVLLVTGWPMLILWRVTRREADVVDILFCLTFTLLAISSLRFFGFYAIAAAPFIARDLDSWLASRRWPRWLASEWLRAALVAALCLWFARGEWARQAPRVGVAIDESYLPIRACDFIAAHGLRGRMFNQFNEGGYLLHRFWPDRGRLPFLDIHQSGGPEIRKLYMMAFENPAGWRTVDHRFQFDLVLLDRQRDPRNPLLNVLDADSAWALVFADDAAALYVRRQGSLAAIASRFAYHHLPGGTAGLGPLGAAVAADAALRATVEGELRRQVESSPWHAGALSLVANIAMSDGRYDEARALLERGLAISPGLGRAHERLGRISLEEGRPRDALRELEREWALQPDRAGVAMLLGTAWQRLGEPGRAREWYRRELKVDPGSVEARDSLAALDRRLAR